MKIKSIEKKDNHIIVTVDVPSVRKTNGKRILVTTKDVEKELAKQNVKFGKCVVATELWNTNPDRLQAQWKFLIPKKTSSTTKTIKTKQIVPTVEVEETISTKPPVVHTRTSSRKSRTKRASNSSSRRAQKEE